MPILTNILDLFSYGVLKQITVKASVLSIIVDFLLPIIMVNQYACWSNNDADKYGVNHDKFKK